MIKLYDNGVYLKNGTEIIEDNGNVQAPISEGRSSETYDRLRNSGSHTIRLEIWRICRSSLIS